MSCSRSFHMPGPAASGGSRFSAGPRRVKAAVCFLLVSVFLLVLGLPGLSAAFPYSRMVAFGDSLTDKGNLYALTFGIIPDGNDYWKGRFSNGPVWAEYLTDAVTTGGELVDLAFGGGTTDSITPPGLESQVLTYTSTRDSSADMLFAIWIGGNDIANGETDYSLIADAVHDALERIATDGGREFLVLNIPNIGSIPRFNSNAPDSVKFTERSMAVNEALDAQLDRFARDHPDYELYRMDTFGFMDDIIAHPDQYGFANVFDSSPVQGHGFINDPPYLFWDDMHPTTEAHALVAERAGNILTAIPASYTGWWYNPDENGSGVSIEIRNGVPFMAWYLFDEAGRPVWYTADGFYSGNTFYGTLYTWSGWPLGGDYLTPARQPVGTMTISFQSPVDALMRWSTDQAGGTIRLKNFLQNTSPGPKDPRDISGWWVDPSYNGMGFFIEAAGGTIFAAWYNYRDDGSPRWWSFGGDFPAGSTSFSGTLMENTGGQCLGCPYQEPVPHETDPVAVQFLPDGTATLTWQGTTFSLQRFNY